jgi:hypothetical protein
VVAHWIEHLFQAYQVFVMNMPRHHSLGALGYLFPSLMHSEWLHYSYAVVMFLGLGLLNDEFRGAARRYWSMALYIQTWHLFEHSLLIVQAWQGYQPISVAQLIVPRIELHLFYTSIVTVPMLIAALLRYVGAAPPASAEGILVPARSRG